MRSIILIQFKMDRDVIVAFLLLAILNPAKALPPEFPANDALGVQDLLIYYGSCGLTYKVISIIMGKYHGLVLSENAVRKRLKRYGQSSRRGPTNMTDAEIQSVIREKLKLLPRTVGYRHITGMMKQEGYHVRRDQVMRCLRQVDPDGVQFRRRHRLQRRSYLSLGPNHIWHVDGYDKLKPYGFPIHGCIDGFSRKLIWLKVGPSNNDPRQVAHHFMNAVARNKGCPLIVQADKGTDNSVIGALQCLFCSENISPENRIESFQHVSSQLNQRIEAWWAMFRRSTAQWWMNLFKDFVTTGVYAPHNDTTLKCMRYAFIPLIQNELDALVEQWNNHHLSVSRNGGCPNGIPNVMFSLPSLSGARNCMQIVDAESIEFGFSQTVEPPVTGDDNFDVNASQICRRLGVSTPTSWQEALQQYFVLLDHMTPN